VRIPDGLEWRRHEPGGAAWLEQLPQVVAAAVEQWSLQLGEPFPDAHISFVAPAVHADGTDAVLKVNFPDEESRHEADALAHWQGEGAVRLLEHDRTRHALLVERCRPGTQLWAVEDDEAATQVAAGALRRIWRPPPQAHDFRALASEAERWAVELTTTWRRLGKPFEKTLLDEAVAACRELGSAQGEAVVLHQDFHGGNVLQAEREPWLAIDPKPLVGEREFDAASYLRDRRELLVKPGAGRLVSRRLDIFETELGLDRERMRRWGIAHALAWGVSADPPKVEQDMIVSARLLQESAPRIRR
jgi:streptomycin 6-kinase